MWAWRSATAARTARIGTLHDGRRWPSTKIGEAADEEAIGPVRFRRAGHQLCRRIGARADARAARCPGCSGIFAGDVPGAIASSDAARGQNPRAGNDRCAGRRNHGAGAEVRGSMVRPVRAQAAVGDTGSCAIDGRNAGEGVGGRTGERRRPARLARPSIERSSVCAEKGAVVLRVNLEGNNRLPRDAVRHEGSRWPRSGRISIGNCCGRGSRLFHRCAWKARSDALCVAPAAGHVDPATDVRGAPRCLAKMVEVPNPLKFLG